MFWENWVGMQIFLGEMVMLRDVFFPKGLSCFLGKLESGARIPRKMVRACIIFRESSFLVTTVFLITKFACSFG